MHELPCNSKHLQTRTTDRREQTRPSETSTREPAETMRTGFQAAARKRLECEHNLGVSDVLNADRAVGEKRPTAARCCRGSGLNACRSCKALFNTKSCKVQQSTDVLL